MRPVILHLDPLAGNLHDTSQITSALVQWLRYELQRETGADISSEAARAAVDTARVRIPGSFGTKRVRHLLPVLSLRGCGLLFGRCKGASRNFCGSLAVAIVLRVHGVNASMLLCRSPQFRSSTILMTVDYL